MSEGNRLPITGRWKFLIFSNFSLACATLLFIFSFAADETILVATSLISLLNFSILLALIFKNNKHFFLLSLPILFNFFWFSLSTFLLELGSYTPELRLVGNATGATSRISLFFITFLLSAFYVYNLGNDRSLTTKRISDFRCTSFIAGLLSLTTIISITYFLYGTAFSNLVDRIVFRQEIAPAYFLPILTALVLSAYYTGTLVRYYSEREKFRSRFIFFIFLTGLALIILAGEKMSALLVTLSLYLAGYFEPNRKPMRIGRPLPFLRLYPVVCISAITILFLGLAVRQYAQIAGSFDFGLIYSLIEDRIVQQGQLNYAADKYTFLGTAEPWGLHDFLSKEILAENDNLKGVVGLMHTFAPPDLFDIYEAAGVTFGDGFPGVLYVYFGLWSYALAPLAGLFLGALLRGLSATGSSNGYVYSVSLFFLLYNSALSAFLNGNFWAFFSLSPSKLAALLIVITTLAARLYNRHTVYRRLCRTGHSPHSEHKLGQC